jgi:hypothetical protein
MTSYEVTLTKEIKHTTFIEADSANDAEQKAWTLLKFYGSDPFKANNPVWIAQVEEAN